MFCCLNSFPGYLLFSTPKAPRGGKMRDPENEVAVICVSCMESTPGRSYEKKKYKKKAKVIKI